MKVKLAYLINRQAKHQKIYNDANDGDRPGWTARADTFALFAIPLLPIVVCWGALKSVHEYEGDSSKGRYHD